MHIPKLTILSVLLAAALAGGGAWGAEEPKDKPASQPTTKPASQPAAKATGPNIVIGQGATVTIQVTADGQGGPAKVEVKNVEIKPANAPAKPAAAQAQAQAQATGIAPAVAGGPAWIGIHLAPIPPAVAAQLGLKEGGVMIVNLIRGSSADKAGLDRYDVITAIDGGQAVRSVGEFIATVRSRKAGDDVRLSVIRKGKKEEAKVKLGTPPAPDKMEYVYEQDAEELAQQQAEANKPLVRQQGPGWVVLGPGGAVVGGGNIQIAVGAIGVAGGQAQGQKTFKMSRTANGRTTEIESADKGAIVVRKTADGKTTETKYRDADELKKKDAEGFEMYKGIEAGGAGAGVVVGQAVAPAVVEAEKFGEDIKAKVKELEQELQKELKAWTVKAREEASAARERIAERLAPERTHQRFTTDDKGRISAEVREGDSAGTFTFRDAQEMKEKAPKLYKAYEELLKSKEKE